MPQFIIQFSVDRYLSCFYFLVVVNRAATDIDGQVSLR